MSVLIRPQQGKLKEEIRKVHQTHGTSEYSFLIEEVPSLNPDGLTSDELLDKYSPAIDAYRQARREALHLYPGVMEVLQFLKSKGCLIVGYTESMAFYTNYRVRKLGLDGVLDFLYSPEDHDLPGGLTPEQIRFYPQEQYELVSTVHRHTPKGEKKPNPHILQSIIRDIGVEPSDCLYIGDSLWKDIAMAKDAHVTSVFAQYGVAIDRQEYNLLREVTHWTDEDVEYEKEIRKREVQPEFVAERSLVEVLSLFDFSRHSEPDRAVKLQALLEIWKKTVDVQQHFNDIGMKIRAAFITITTALLGAVGVSLWREVKIQILGYEIQLAVFLLFLGGIALFAFYFMDRHWYHRLLIGSVRHGELLETEISKFGVQCSLGDEISKASPILGFIHSAGKVRIFYTLFLIGFLGLAAILLINDLKLPIPFFERKPAHQRSLTPANPTSSTDGPRSVTTDTIDSSPSSDTSQVPPVPAAR